MKNVDALPADDFKGRIDDFVTRRRWLIVPFLALTTLLLMCLIATRFMEKAEREATAQVYVPDQVIVAGDPDFIDEVINAALPGASLISSIQSVEYSDCDCDDAPPVPSPTASLSDLTDGDETADGSVAIDLIPLPLTTQVLAAETPGAVTTAVLAPTANALSLIFPDDTGPVDHPLNFEIRLIDVGWVQFGASVADLDDSTRKAMASVTAKVAEMNANTRMHGESVVVVADPNYIFRRGQSNSKKDKFKADPNDPPGGIRPDSVGSGIANVLYDDQWLWSGVATPSSNADGTGVELVIFDTSPFTSGGTHQITWASDPFDIDVRATAVSVPAVPTSYTPAEVAALKQHGLSVASLANSMAPGAELILYRVLNDVGDGTAYGVMQSIYDYLFQAPKSGGVLTTPAVLNLSLGLRCSEIPSLTQDEVDDLNVLATTIATTYAGQSLLASPCPTVPGTQQSNVPSLYAVISLAHALGASVVAASGNDSGTVLETSQLPALYDTVISVAGSTNVTSTRACFSNAGQVSAPSGGVAAASAIPCSDSMPEKCRDDNATNQTTEGCDEALISVVNPTSFINQTNVDEFSSGHAFWTGTSFSAPMVAGGMARIMEKYPSIALTPASVEETVNCGTGSRPVRVPLPTVNLNSPLGVGKIDWARALGPQCAPP